MKWYFSLSEASMDRAGHDWRGLVRVSVASALANTALTPHMLYDGDENAFTRELTDMGVRVIHHRVSFYSALAERAQKTGPEYLSIAAGAFLRVEIPEIERDDDIILYTDSDVIFRADPVVKSVPRFFSAAPQESRSDFDNDMNTGVLVMNLPALGKSLTKFRKFIVDNLYSGWPGCDQANYRQFYQGKWDRLDLGWNWKPYWGWNPDASIIHWHGPKPVTVRALLNGSRKPAKDDWGRLFKSSPTGYERYLAEWDAVSSGLYRDVTGHLDFLNEKGGSGWAISSADPNNPVSFSVEIDNEPVARVVCDARRPDIAGLYETQVGGFQFEIPQRFLADGAHTVRLISPARRPYCLRFMGQQAEAHSFRIERGSTLKSATKKKDILSQLDEISPKAFRGWCVDRSFPNRPVCLKLIIDGTSIAELMCDLARPDVATATGLLAEVGFNYVLPRKYFDEKPHCLELKDLEDVPVSLRIDGKEYASYEFCQSWVPTVLSHIDGMREGVIKGWLLTEDHLTKRRTGRATILVTCEGERIQQLKADRHRPDVGKLHAAEAECGFEFNAPPSLRRARPQSFRFFLQPYDLELNGSPCITSFPSDNHTASMLAVGEQIDQIHAVITRMRRDLRLMLPKPIYTIADYNGWAVEYFAALTASVAAKRHIARSRLRTGAEDPLVSIVCPTYRPNPEHFSRAVESVIAQSYQNWELIIVDDGSQVPELAARIAAFVARDLRVRLVKRTKNGGISTATNAGIKAARGQWVAFFDHDDLLVDVALEVMVKAAREHDALVLYSDEDKIDDAGYLSEPAFKSDWNYRLLLSVNYICHLLMVDRGLLRKAGPLNRQYDGAQDHALLLRLSELVDPSLIHHVPEVLYHWRKSDISTASSTKAKAYVVDAGVAAVSDHLKRRVKPATVTNINNSTWYRIAWQYDESPSVTIIIPFKDAAEVTRECLNRVLVSTDYSNFDVILVDNWSTSLETEAFCQEAGALPNVSIIRVEEEFNYSRLNNIAAARSKSDYLVLMNNDLYVADKGWLRTLVNESLADEKVAVVGGKYLYPNGTIQHGGVVLGVGGVATHVHIGLGPDDPGYGARALFAQEMSAVTAACLLIRNSVFKAVGGLDEIALQVAFNDVDLCLKVTQAGWKVIWTPDFVAEHHESLSRGDDEENTRKEARFFDEMQTMINRWGPGLTTDPYYSKHFSLDGRPFYDLVQPSFSSRSQPEAQPKLRLVGTGT